MPKTPSKLLKNMPSLYEVYEPIGNSTEKTLNIIGKCSLLNLDNHQHYFNKIKIYRNLIAH